MKEIDDPYRALGVDRTATAEAIRKAFRAAAKECHPDLYPDDPIKAERFKQLSWAHALLSDAQARARFDRGMGAHGPGSGRQRPNFGGAGSAAKPGRRSDRRFRFPGIDGVDINYDLHVTAADAKAGAQRPLQTTDGRTLRVKVPPNAQNGHVLRLRGQGLSGKFGGSAGDALITVHVALPHGLRNEADGVHCDLDVPVAMAVLGGKMQVPTVDGRVSVTVPPDSNGGDVLRLRGRGVADDTGTRGDQFVHLRIVLPRPADPALQRLLRDWAGAAVKSAEPHG